jgi:type VI secretion system protein ImpM
MRCNKLTRGADFLFMAARGYDGRVEDLMMNESRPDASTFLRTLVPAPGFFGKVPARGDFVSRRVPAALRSDWESWLAALTVAARDALGSSRPDEWLTAPLWHFMLGSGIAPPDGAAGVLVASADRVGRLFPFTIIGAVSGSVASDWPALNIWAGAAEALTLKALTDDFDPDVLDAELISIGPPPGLACAKMGESTPRGGHWHLLFDDDGPHHVGDDDSALQFPGPEQSVWYTSGSERVPPMHLRCVKLPDRATAAAMITGGFDFPGNC